MCILSVSVSMLHTSFLYLNLSLSLSTVLCPCWFLSLPQYSPPSSTSLPMSSPSLTSIFSLNYFSFILPPSLTPVFPLSTTFSCLQSLPHSPSLKYFSFLISPPYLASIPLSSTVLCPCYFLPLPQYFPLNYFLHLTLIPPLSNVLSYLESLPPCPSLIYLSFLLPFP